MRIIRIEMSILADRNCEVCRSENHCYLAENLSNYILYFRNWNTLYFSFGRNGNAPSWYDKCPRLPKL